MEPADDGLPLAPNSVSLALDDADGRATEIGSRSGREARLDLLLAEELAVDRDFAVWFLREAGEWRSRPNLPHGLPEQTNVRMNLFEGDSPIPSEAHGETDIDLKLKWGDGRSLAVVVEDKVWSGFQWRQPERCVARAESRAGVAVLVAPLRYIRRHSAKAMIFHGWVSAEEIIERIESPGAHPDSDATVGRRRQWRAKLLTELISRPPRPVVADDVPSVEFTRFCTDWFEAHAPSVIANPRSCHSAGQGWLWFESPRGLGYKASGWTGKPLAGVDLYVGDHGFEGTAGDLDEVLRDVGCPEGFRRTVDTAKPPNLVLRFECAKVYPSDGPPAPDTAREKDIVEALEACRRAADWLQVNQERLTVL